MLLPSLSHVTVRTMLKGLALLGLLVSVPAAAEGERRWFIHLGPLVGLRSHVRSGKALGTAGAELTAGRIWQLDTYVPISFGGFAQAEATQLEGATAAVRLAAGFQATFSLFGIEAGLGWEQPSASNQSTHALHLGAFLAGPLPLPNYVVFVSIGLRVEVPIAGSTSAGVALGPVLSIKFPFEIIGR